MSSAVTALTIATALGCALNGGILYAFSSFVMPALARLSPENGIRAMQSINVMAVTPPFMVVFMGTGLLCAALVVVAIVNWGEAYSGWLIAAGIVYPVGMIWLTMRYHVPRNNQLAAAEPAEPASAGLWERYQREWTRGNHLRAAAGVVAGGLAIGGLLAG